MIQLKNLRFSYNEGLFSLILSDLTIPAGEKIALTGTSGQGKTTLLNLISGVLTPDAGDIFIGDENLCTMTERERRRFRLEKTASVFQDFELLEYLNVFDNIRLPRFLGYPVGNLTDFDSRTVELAGAAGISGHLRRFPSRLSKGEQQRVALCRALVTKPSLILADEATGNLDSDNKNHIWDLMEDYCLSSGATLIAATHDHSILERFDRTLELQDLLLPGEVKK